jgi:Fe-S-cluster containining protein
VQCRSGCAACCIAPSISTPLPKMPQGKPAGVACAHLTHDLLCELFGLPERPSVCGSLQPSFSMCGENRAQALAYLNELETLTAPV